jgi:hypothetical protein
MANAQAAKGNNNIMMIAGIAVLVIIIVAAVLLYHPSTTATSGSTTVPSNIQATTAQPTTSLATTTVPATEQQAAANQSVNATEEYAYILSMEIYTNVYNENWTAATSEMNIIGGILANVSPSQLPSELTQGYAELRQDIQNKNQTGVYDLLNTMANSTANMGMMTTTSQISANQSISIAYAYVYDISLQIYYNVRQQNWVNATNEINAIEGLFTHIPASHLPSGIAPDYASLKQDIANKNETAALYVLKSLSSMPK